MGRRNYLVEGVSGTGKTSVCEELQRRGYHAIHGDGELAYQGDPATGTATDGHTHEHHIWRVEKVKALVANQDEAETFFCGGSRNFWNFISLFDDVFVLEIDVDTLNRRLDERTEDEWGGRPAERALIARLHQTGEDTPNGIIVDATAPVARVVDEILGMTTAGGSTSRRECCGGAHPLALPQLGSADDPHPRRRRRPAPRHQPPDRADPREHPMSNAETDTPQVVFACVRNGGRSVISRVLTQHYAGGRVTALSAGTQPGEHIHYEVADVLEKLGLDTSQEKPKLLTRDTIAASTIAITLGAARNAPTYPV